MTGIHDQSFHPQQQSFPPHYNQPYRYNRNDKWDQQVPPRDEGLVNSGFNANLYSTTPPFGMVQTLGGSVDNRLVFNFFVTVLECTSFRFLLMASEEMEGLLNDGLMEVAVGLQFLQLLENLDVK